MKGKVRPHEEVDITSNQLSADDDRNVDCAFVKLEEEDPLQLEYDTDLVKEEQLDIKCEDIDDETDPLVSSALQDCLRESSQVEKDPSENIASTDDEELPKSINLRPRCAQRKLIETPEQTGARWSRKLKRAQIAYSKKRSKNNKILKILRGDNPNTAAKTNEQRRINAERQRDLRTRETPMQTDARRLKQRIARVKDRLLEQLISTETDWQAEKARQALKMRQIRQKRRAVETPEQAAKRKMQQAEQVRLSRSRMLAAESPEEAQARRAANCINHKNRYNEMRAKETRNERTARKERERQYREMNKERLKARRQLRALERNEELISICGSALETTI